MKKLFLMLAVIIAATVNVVAQNRTVTGIVIDAATDEPLMGASVLPVGSSSGVATDIDGKFSLTVPASVKEVTVSYLGYTSATLPIQADMTVKLEPSSTLLDQVVVTGYGSGKKLGSVVGSVAVIGDDALENVTTPSFVDALQGQVPGLTVFSASGDPSSTENDIRIRGVNSLYSSNTPLFILDGAPITETVFTTLNPNDIENITVLKDAASVAIYGSRAANGVIVITSKKGKFGEQAKVTLRAKYGWSQMTPDKVDMMNSQQYKEYRSLIGNPITNPDALYAIDELGINTDWRKEMFNSSAPTYSLEAAVQGGTENTSYYMSLNHLDQEGIIDQSGMRRETLRFSLDSKINDWFRIGLQTNLGYTKYEQNNESGATYSGTGVYATNPMVFARKAMPYDSPNYWVRNENGGVDWLGKAQYLHFTGAPTPGYINGNRKVHRTRVTANAALFEQITPIKGLTIRAQQAVDAYDQRLHNYGFAKETLYTPMGDVYSGSVEPGEIDLGYHQETFARYYQFTYTNTAEYRFNIDNLHNFSALVGEESIISKSHSFGVFADGYSDNRQLLLGQATAVSPSDLSESIGQLSMNSVFFNLSYDFDSRYFFDFNLRRDGSSRFAPGHRWGTFFSVGGMWDAKAEKFLSGYTWLDAAKLRISYGTTGNSSFANYGYFGLLGAGGLYDGTSSITITQAPNPDLSWESVRAFDLGVNAGFLNIFNVDVDFYVKNTHDMLMNIPYSYTTGLSGGWGNVGSMRNTGVDVDLHADVIKTKDWYWGLRANFNYNKNEITELFDGLNELPQPNAMVNYKKGHPASEFYCVRYAGVDPRDGKQMWYTKEGNLTKTFNEERDAVLIGKTPYSPWTGGFGTDLRWKNISLHADFTWAAEKYMINNDLWFITNNQFATSYNQRVEMLNVWTHPGQETDIPAVGEELQFDTRWLENASYVRLKNLTVQYSLPKQWLSAARLQNVALHFTGRNLLTFTDFTGYDPEPESNLVTFFYPNTRQYEFGIEVTF
ncbi:MAG: TonB-dependent receptor [Barnesiella sp.]|nr:TonB-dependent receptor [Barnesiella sp.]